MGVNPLHILATPPPRGDLRGTIAPHQDYLRNHLAQVAASTPHVSSHEFSGT